ncbi:MAG: site-2 protease family protein [Gammaproteobacteria bacterium]|jgi:Zn-dependent protease/predicted transcriptional regulator|nr:site-2 protease family protein [Gammaproteobacteria bacterium]MDH3847594.1 site-2 protease family protein [Gammaproteobacteria bacterium]MDH3863598.1 site-2 protease family protein [Gammaproteobacteria bacterium]MDH3904363.1 site-2 protease family protein [Gammaproteobacteria bacterium]MDH4003927.1 site-2 protease family protein [Gammaproteobacteria bacterium]
MNSEVQRAAPFRSFHLFTLFGFEVKLDLSWLLLALLISWSMGAGWFPSRYPELSVHLYAWMGVAVAVGVFFSIVFHEFSHSIVARHYGMPIRGITLFIFGGVAEMESEPPDPKAEFLMAIAGPISSFLLAALLWGSAAIAQGAAWPQPVIGVLSTLAVINFTVAVFNLVPAFPLDGGRVLRAALWHWRRDLHEATFISSRIGRGFGTALMILGVVAIVGGNLIGGMWWFLIGLFVRGAASSSYQQLVLKDMVEGQPVRRFMRSGPVTVAPSLSVEEWVEEYVYRHHYKMYPVLDGSRLLGCVTVDSLQGIRRDDWSSTRVADLMESRSASNTVDAGTDTMALLTDILKPGGRSRFMVVEDDRLVGVIALKDLLEIIALKLQIESPGRRT